MVNFGSGFRQRQRDRLLCDKLCGHVERKRNWEIVFCLLCFLRILSCKVVKIFPGYLVTFAFSQHFVNIGTITDTITTRNNLEFSCLFCSENSRCDSSVMRQ